MNFIHAVEKALNDLVDSLWKLCQEDGTGQALIFIVSGSIYGLVLLFKKLYTFLGIL